jgi:hypothetical protein
MRIPIEPTSTFVAGRGTLIATHLDVHVNNYVLGGEVRGSYELVAVLEPAQPPSKEFPRGVPAKEVVVANSSVMLTKEQADAWGQDDSHFCRCVAINAGLKPAA